MASIFKNSIIKKKLEVIDVPNFEEKIEIVKKWHDYYHNGTLKQDKETSVEQTYNQDFFIKLLGYEEKPSTPYSLEPKATTDKGQLPDLILGYFDADNRTVSSVVELKGASIPLDRPQKREGNHSPIQQAFKYKTQYTHCPFVIASNFYEFRLFQDNQLDYEIWTLDDLVNSDNDYFNLKKFYLLLSKENFIAKDGKTATEELLSDIRIEEENISKKFYKEYGELRTELLRDIYSKNKVVQEDIDLGIEKAQKIIDRIVFVCFCEDQELLPENTLQRVLKMQESSFGSLWGSLKAFFDAIDKGSDKLYIPDGYNGGLFKTDNSLDNLQIDDKILKKLANLGNYNFRDDLSVNILGRIFEQSISDLEDIKIKVEESRGVKDIDNIGKRKKDGIFYTPDYIVNYIIKNSLGKYLEDKEVELKNKHKLKEDILDENYEKREKLVYEEYQNFLHNIKVLDPACGSGAFLVKVFDFLLAENKRVGHILGGLFSTEDYLKSILKNNIFGVDLNRESVEITKLSLWLKTAQKGKKLTILDGNIKCGNSLISDPKIDGNKAFDWNKEFPEIMENGGFDVVVGNPPYVRNTQLNNVDKKYYIENYFSAYKQFDLYILFNELGLSLLKNGGFVSFIQPNKFLAAEYGIKLLNLYYHNADLIKLKNYSLENIFEDASVYPYVTIFKKKSFDLNIKITQKSIFEYFDDSGLFDGFDNQLKSLNIIRIINTKSNTLKGILKTVVQRGVPNTKINLNQSKGYSAISSVNLSLPYSYTGLDQVILYKDKKIEKLRKGDFENKNIIMMPRTVLRIRAILKDEVDHVLDRIYYFSVIKEYDPYYVLTIINSKVTTFWYDYYFGTTKVGGGYFDLKGIQIGRIPIPKISQEEQKPFIELADKMIDLNKKFYEKKDTFSRRIKDNYKLEKLSKKIEKFYETDFGSFVNELKKKKVIIPISEQDELEKYFNQYKTELLKLQKEINTTDKEIDKMIYKLYGLTEEEIKIVRSN